MDGTLKVTLDPFDEILGMAPDPKLTVLLEEVKFDPYIVTCEPIIPDVGETDVTVGVYVC